MDYERWNECSLVSDCLQKFGLDELAHNIFKTGIIKDALPILVEEARKRQDKDVLDRLYFGGLIYA